MAIETEGSDKVMSWSPISLTKCNQFTAMVRLSSIIQFSWSSPSLLPSLMRWILWSDRFATNQVRILAIRAE